MNPEILAATRRNADLFDLLRRLTIERTGWRRYVFGRWLYADEPLRADAARILREREVSFLIEIGCTSAAKREAA